jgi:hypothetical protein
LMDQPVTAVYDANILYPAPLRDLFMRLAEVGLVRARWTDAIHEEWARNVLADNPRLSAERLARTRTLMNEAIRDCLVTGFEDLLAQKIFGTNVCGLRSYSGTKFDWICTMIRCPG